MKTLTDSFFSKFEIFFALRKTFRKGYSLKFFSADFLAGLVVALVAIPLNMSLAISTNVPPEMGLYTAIVGGFIVALLGGSKFQVTGPTAAFIVILLPIVAKFGLAGLMTAGLMAGIWILIMGITGIGQLVQIIPYPVTIGLTSGIAVVIFTIQLKDFLGLTLVSNPESFLERIPIYFKSRGTFSYQEFIIGFTTLLGLFLLPKIKGVKKVPAPLIILPIVTIITEVSNRFGLLPSIATIESKFAIPTGLFHFVAPWNMSESFHLSLATIKSLMIPSIAIAILASLESLLSAVIADTMGKTKHSPRGELIALGIGNIIVSFFQGIPATGALARTSTNIRFGAKSPIASMFHALFMLLTLLFLAPLISKLPLSSLAALLMMVAYNMSDYHRFFYLLKVSPKSDKAVLLSCFFLTVIFDMVIGIMVGVMIAAALFIKRTMDLSDGEIINFDTTKSPHLRGLNLSKDIMVYNIKGPFFFGVADKIITHMGSEDEIKKKKGVIFLMDHVPSMDATGLTAFQNILEGLKDIPVVLVGLTPWTTSFLRKASIIDSKGNGTKSFQNLVIKETLSEASEIFRTVPGTNAADLSNF